MPVVEWSFGHPAWLLLMLAFCSIGGYIGAIAAKKVRPGYVRIFVIIISASMTVAFFLRRH